MNLETPRQLSSSDKELLREALDAMERLMKIFRAERILYNVGAFASLLLFLYAGYLLFTQDTVTPSSMTLILGASGVSTACSGRVAFFLNKGFVLVCDLIRKLANLGDEKDE